MHDNELIPFQGGRCHLGNCDYKDPEALRASAYTTKQI